MMKQATILVVAGLFSAGAWASCYRVLGPKGELLSESTNPPVNMAYPLHVTVPARFGPGAVLIFGIADGNCGSRMDEYRDLTVTEVGFAAETRREGLPVRGPRQDRQ
ncbi:MAG: hypothetical protein I8H77_18700 [Comamonadaceae bacterium]|nr:hypothetical protein [Comamonadaceae bacterium]